MPKHSRKRQKLSNNEDPHPLLDDSEKDDEERRLESLIFGTKYVPSNSKDNQPQQGLESLDDDGRQFQNLLDNDLFFVDDQVPDDHDSDKGDEEPVASGSGSDEETEESLAKTPETLKPNRKVPAWVDNSDPTTDTISLSSSKRLRKLRDLPDEQVLTGREYESRLRRQFERINPEPEWAAKARKKSSKTANDGDEDEDEEADIGALLSSTSGILTSKSSSRAKVLASGTIDISRLRDANQSAQNAGCGGIKSLAFHPSERVPVLCVGSLDRRVRIYNVDGHTSPLLQTLHIPSLPLTSQSSVTFHPSGSHLLLTGSRPYFYVYDLTSGTLTSSDQTRKGLWGTRFEDHSSPSLSMTPSRKRGRSRGVGWCPQFWRCRYGNDRVRTEHWVHARSSRSRRVVGSLKCSNGGGGIKGLWWNTATTTTSIDDGVSPSSRDYLSVLSGDSEIYLWDVGERRCVRRWTDDGGFRGAGRVLAGSNKGSGWLAVGSNTGLVNIYGSDSFLPSSSSTFTSAAKPSWSNSNSKPLKTIKNLVTPISTLRFNHDAQVLAMASKEKKDGMRLVHLPSLTAFSNWPTSSTPLGHVTALDFSARSEYLAIGNTRGRVLLYHLKNFGVH
ncbi:hypothetical protein D9757_006757 [Collybiopsis confluens]|uniref:U3 small nucleolar RNA-associated protein 18 n=1 Tax=Collybiopsis confluens TaxID=2823264 RepID=A0A8H5HM09_9AGAR|nr:hypothetical protein D9757_006757 [Collybiopsis confluens]